MEFNERLDACNEIEVTLAMIWYSMIMPCVTQNQGHMSSEFDWLTGPVGGFITSMCPYRRLRHVPRVTSTRIYKVC